MNKIILIGRLTRDPEVKYSQGAEPMAIARYSLAVNRKFKKDGQPDADFLNCVAFGRNGDFAEKFLKKGMQIAVTGSIQTGSYTDKDGNKKYTTDIIIEEHEFTESKKLFEGRVGGSDEPVTQSDKSSGFAVVENLNDDDLPF